MSKKNFKLVYQRYGADSCQIVKTIEDEKTAVALASVLYENDPKHNILSDVCVVQTDGRKKRTIWRFGKYSKDIYEEQELHPHYLN